MPEALIWGASGGIGSALVEELARQGWKVYAAARNEAAVPASAAAVFEFDALKPFTFSHVAMMVAQESTGVQLVAYTPGVLHAQPLDVGDTDAWQTTIAVNLTGAALAIRASIPLLADGALVAGIGAQVDRLILPKFGAYAVSKAGLQTLFQVAQKEHRSARFCLVRPGAVDTPFWEQVSFPMPGTALSPAAVASAIVEAFHAGTKGQVDL
jgi:NAD(P)-dependent dehydrogenase (short-subunit alcohol dehydrogenase family)